MKVNIIGATGYIKDKKEFMSKVKNISAKYGIKMQLFNLNYIYGKRHLQAAAYHAINAYEKNRSIAKNLEIEILLYAACDRQIENAIKKVGIKKGKNEIGIVIIGSCKPGRIIKELGLEKNEKVFHLKKEKKKIAKKYGINNNEMKIASIEKLILEKMAIMGLEI